MNVGRWLEIMKLGGWAVKVQTLSDTEYELQAAGMERATDAFLAIDECLLEARVYIRKSCGDKEEALVHEFTHINNNALEMFVDEVLGYIDSKALQDRLLDQWGIIKEQTVQRHTRAILNARRIK